MVRTNIVEKELLWLPNGEDEIVDDCVAHWAKLIIRILTQSGNDCLFVLGGRKKIKCPCARILTMCFGSLMPTLVDVKILWHHCHSKLFDATVRSRIGTETILIQGERQLWISMGFKW
jgi:hypothetical protein